MGKIIFFDIDGTLLDHNSGTNGIPEAAKKQMLRLQENGYLLFVASGRPYTFISKTVSDFGFDGYVLCNGAHVEMNGEFIYHQPMDKEKTRILLEQFKDIDCEYIIETSRYGYLRPEFKVLDEFFIQCDINEELMCYDFKEEDVYQNALKIEVSATGKAEEKIEGLIKGKFGYDSHGTANSFEIYSSVVTKATGVEKVLAHLHIPKEDSYAYGDGLNDLEMIQVVGHGIAMGNAVPELKNIADEVCGYVGENGLAKALEKLK